MKKKYHKPLTKTICVVCDNHLLQYSIGSIELTKRPASVSISDDGEDEYDSL